jgi:hypothetical protein
MAKQTGLGDNFFIGGRDLSGDVNSLSTISARRSVLDVTGIDQSGIDRVQGLGDGELTFVTWFNDGTNAAHTAVSGLPTTNVIALYMRGTAANSPAAGLVAKQINYDPTRGQDGSWSATVQCLGTSGIPLEWGVLLQAEATHSSAGSSSSKDDSASSSSGLAAYLQLIDINSGTPTIKLQDSTDNSSWADLVSFTAVANGNEPTAERVEVSGTVNRYLRVTSTGTFSNAKFIIAYRRGETTDVTAYA